MGDAATHESFVQNITRRLPNTGLVAFSQNPDATQRTHNIISYPISYNCPGDDRSTTPNLIRRHLEAALRRRLLYFMTHRFRTIRSLTTKLRGLLLELGHLGRSYSRVKSLDILIIAGGGQLCDLWWFQPYNIFKFCFLGRLSKTPVYIVGVGADLLRGRSAKLFAGWAVRLASYVSFRDRQSQELIRSIGVNRETQICPDPAYGLNLGALVNSQPGVTIKGRIGLNPMGFCDSRVWPRNDTAAYESYLNKLTEFCLWALQDAYTIELFTTDLGIDKFALTDLRDALLRTDPSLEATGRLVYRPLLSLPAVLEQMGGFEFVITSKFHGVVFCHLLEKPLIALSYLPKIDYLMNAIEQCEYCLNIETVCTKALIATFLRLVGNKSRIIPHLHETAAIYATALQAEFDRCLVSTTRNGVGKGQANAPPELQVREAAR